MKFHKLYIAAIGAASMAMAGCELDIVNSDQLNTTNMWVDESDVTGATTGIYFELRNAFRQNYTNQFFWGELRVGPAMWDRGTNRSLMDSDMLEVLHSLLNGGTSSVSWTNLYTCINQCNSVIKYAPSVEMSDQTRSYCLGNAYFVRAYVYYWIARVWGDAPVILTPTESTGREIYPSRSPRAEVYAQVAQDIESALTHITSNAQGCYYATVDNINMLKADFALWMYAVQKGGDSYLTMAGEALGELGLSDALLEPAYADIFSSSNKCGREVIFAVHQDVSEALNGPAYYLGWNESYVEAAYRNNPVPTTGGNQWWWYTDTYRALLQADPADTRAALTCRTADYGTGGRRIGWTEKLMGRVDNGTRIFDSDFILYRYGEAFLMAAEARYYGKDYAGALEALAPLAARAYGRKDYYTDTSPEAVLQAIVDEYLREMVGEGRTWWMLLRTDKIWEYSADIAAQRDKNPNILLWPITQAAMSRNYNLTQTEGWY